MADAAQRDGEIHLELEPLLAAPWPEPLPLHGRPALPDIWQPGPVKTSVRISRHHRTPAQPSTLQVIFFQIFFIYFSYIFLLFQIPAAAAPHEVLPELPSADTQERSHLSSLQGKVKVQEPEETQEERVKLCL